VKIKKILFYVLICLLVFIIYFYCKSDKINYVVIGDSISESRNPYNEIIYGYTDYIVDYLKRNNRFGSYVNFSSYRNTIQNVIDDIYNNKQIFVNGESYNIKRSLRESDLVTVTVGMADLYNELIINNNNVNYNNFDTLLEKMEKMLVDLKKYAKNDIIVMGLFNPLKYSDDKNKFDNILIKLNNDYKKICERNGVYFVEIFDEFENSIEFFQDGLNINPTHKGYKKIYDSFIKKIIELI